MMRGREIIAVNGIWLPDPDGVEAGHNVMDKYALRAVQNGLLHREIAAKKYDFTLNWSLFDDPSAYTEVWRALDSLSEYATFRILHPSGDGYVVFEGYTTGPKATMQSYYSIDGQMFSRWRSLKASIIER